MTIKFKEGVEIEGIVPDIITAMSKVDDYLSYYRASGLIVTAGSDGKHKEGSKHYTGEAFDMRTWTTPTSGIQLNKGNKEKIAYDLRQILGSDFDVIVEATHIHIELDP